jgi:hypothetical protein
MERLTTRDKDGVYCDASVNPIERLAAFEDAWGRIEAKYDSEVLRLCTNPGERGKHIALKWVLQLMEGE